MLSETKKTSAYIVSKQDNVGTAITDLPVGEIQAIGYVQGSIFAIEPISFGYKIAVKPIAKGEYVIKYGINIARATRDIRTGECVHSHNAESLNDMRSHGFDIKTAAPTDMCYDLDEL